MTVGCDTLALQTVELCIEFGIIYIIITTPKITTSFYEKFKSGNIPQDLSWIVRVELLNFT